jgi:hypothetical protein
MSARRSHSDVEDEDDDGQSSNNSSSPSSPSSSDADSDEEGHFSGETTSRNTKPINPKAKKNQAALEEMLNQTKAHKRSKATGENDDAPPSSKKPPDAACTSTLGRVVGLPSGTRANANNVKIGMEVTFIKDERWKIVEFRSNGFKPCPFKEDYERFPDKSQVNFGQHHVGLQRVNDGVVENRSAVICTNGYVHKISVSLAKIMMDRFIKTMTTLPEPKTYKHYATFHNAIEKKNYMALSAIPGSPSLAILPWPLYEEILKSKVKDPKAAAAATADDAPTSQPAANKRRRPASAAAAAAASHTAAVLEGHVALAREYLEQVVAPEVRRLATQHNQSPSVIAKKWMNDNSALLDSFAEEQQVKNYWSKKKSMEIVSQLILFGTAAGFRVMHQWLAAFTEEEAKACDMSTTLMDSSDSTSEEPDKKKKKKDKKSSKDKKSPKKDKKSSKKRKREQSDDEEEEESKKQHKKDKSKKKKKKKSKKDKEEEEEPKEDSEAEQQSEEDRASSSDTD